MFRSILVPLDGSDYSARALPLAEQLARLTQGRLDLVMVHQPPPVWYTPEAGVGDLSVFDDEARGRERRYLQGIESELSATSGLRVTTTLLDGEIGSAIGHFAERRGVDIVVMTTHARSGLSRLWLGSVADKLIRMLHIPVLVAHPDGARPRPETVRRIFVALDGSDVAASVLDHARMVAQLAGAEIVLGTIVEPAPVFLAPYEYPTPSVLDSNELRECNAREYLLMVQEYLARVGMHASIRVAIGSKVARELVRLAVETRCDMMILATHGRGGFDRAVMGSVVDQVVRQATIPLLILRPPVATSAEQALAAAGGNQVMGFSMGF